MSASLVGSEMCIRDSPELLRLADFPVRFRENRASDRLLALRFVYFEFVHFRATGRRRESVGSREPSGTCRGPIQTSHQSALQKQGVHIDAHCTCLSPMLEFGTLECPNIERA
eukprot:249254-Alexandrium_andersonii.AAC.1